MSERIPVRGSKFSAFLGARFFVEADGSATVTAALQDAHEGPPHHIHGGVLAALLDEAMGAAAWHAGHKSVAVNLTVNYKRPVSVGDTVHVIARIDRIEGRKAFTSAVLTLPDSSIAAEGTAIFVAVAGLPTDAFGFGDRA